MKSRSRSDSVPERKRSFFPGCWFGVGVALRKDRTAASTGVAHQHLTHQEFMLAAIDDAPVERLHKKSLATTYSPTLKGQYHRRGRA
jgi:hypothetical protein